MRLSVVTDRLSLNLPACTSARLRCATTLQPSERQSSHRYCCNCSSAASTSGATDEEQLSTFGCIRHATRAVKHAYRLCKSQRQRLEASQLSDSFLPVRGKDTSVGSVRYTVTYIALCACHQLTHAGACLVCLVCDVALVLSRWLPPFSNMCLMLGIAVLPGNGFADLGRNYVFMAGFWGWFLAQTCKVPVKSLQYAATWVTHEGEEVPYMQIFTKRWRKGVWDLKAIVDSGGMPSSHSALCSVRNRRLLI